jgi:hypothetical protein
MIAKHQLVSCSSSSKYLGDAGCDDGGLAAGDAPLLLLALLLALILLAAPIPAAAAAVRIPVMLLSLSLILLLLSVVAVLHVTTSGCGS